MELQNDNEISKEIEVGDKVRCKGIGYPHWKGKIFEVTLVFPDNKTIGILNAVRVWKEDFELINIDIMTREEIHNNILKIREFHKRFLRNCEEPPTWNIEYMRHRELVYSTIKTAKEQYGMELDLLKYL